MQLLRTRAQRELAAFQDAAVDLLYHTDSTIIMHGGTAIWRCYGGSRFSNDIDIYLVSKAHMEKLKEEIRATASAYGVVVEKVKDTGDLVFIGMSLGGLYLKVEINYQKTSVAPIAGRFEKSDGTYTEIRTLSPSDFILEKIAAYKDRKFIRDLYDIYILSDRVSEPASIRKQVLDFIDAIAPPVNANLLPTLIYTGPVPSFENMVEHIRGVFA
jgi:predicted nucleotidyltransferase component of viral defense system